MGVVQAWVFVTYFILALPASSEIWVWKSAALHLTLPAGVSAVFNGLVIMRCRWTGAIRRSVPKGHEDADGAAPPA